MENFTQALERVLEQVMAKHSPEGYEELLRTLRTKFRRECRKASTQGRWEATKGGDYLVRTKAGLEHRSWEAFLFRELQ